MTHDFSVSPDWSDSFFSEPVIHFWDAVVPVAATAAEIAFLLRQVQLQPAAMILDMPCGSGRHALALAEKGFRVTGVDRSETAIDLARAAASLRQLPLQFLQGDMRNFRIAEPYDALLCLGNSLGYHEPRTTMQILENFAAAVRVGGHLVIDTAICAESVFPFEADRAFSFPGGAYSMQVSYDPMQSAIKTCAELSWGGQKYPLIYQHFVMTSGELVRALGSVGFAISGLFGDTDASVYAPGSRRLLLVAVRI